MTACFETASIDCCLATYAPGYDIAQPRLSSPINLMTTWVWIKVLTIKAPSAEEGASCNHHDQSLERQFIK